MKDGGMPEWVADKLAEILEWFSLGEYAEVTNTVEEVLGREARTFDEFAEEFAQAI